MTTKEWFMRARNTDEEISRLLRERRKAYERCLSITSRLNATCVSGTRDPHKYDKLVEYENLIDEKVDELYDTKCEIEKAIAKLKNPLHREVLHRYYINGESFEKIAASKRYTYRNICYLHGKALLEAEKTFH